MVEKLEKISTGIPNLDWILKGGIPKKPSVMWSRV